MKLLYLSIENFKNLRDFSVAFDDTLATTVIIGRNGTGKSNLLEALILIFRDLDLYRPPAFKYRLDYICRGYEVNIDADPARSTSLRKQVLIKVEGEPISYQLFSQQTGRNYLPSYVFGYYSGPSNRMEEHFDEHQKRFYNGLIRGENKPLRPMLYARLVHSQFVLLSFFNDRDERILSFLQEHLSIEGMESVLFVMRKPPWSSKNGDPRFWNARGVVSRFLNRLYALALAPLRIPLRVSVDFKGTTTLEHLYLYVPGMNALNKLYSYYNNQQEFFKALESTYISEILREVRIRVKVRNADGSLTFRDLSEGEQQLLMVLGLLRFTKEDEALFLLDEPDTHLNPVWGIQYLDFMHEIVGNQPTSHVIMSTHNPLVISSLERSQVQIMQRNDKTGRVFSSIPEENPRGMGVAAILTSDLFGLRSTLDLPTQRLVDERRLLAVKERLSNQEKLRLEELNEQLENLDFSITLRDSLYEKFVKEMTRRQRPEIQQLVSLTPEQQEEQRQLVLSILRELQEEEEEQRG